MRSVEFKGLSHRFWTVDLVGPGGPLYIEFGALMNQLQTAQHVPEEISAAYRRWRDLKS